MEPALVHDAAAAVSTDNPFILELIKEGVHYIQYKDLITTGELGSVSCGRSCECVCVCVGGGGGGS